jgi:hypothetical protein
LVNQKLIYHFLKLRIFGGAIQDISIFQNLEILDKKIKRGFFCFVLEFFKMLIFWNRSRIIWIFQNFKKLELPDRKKQF